VTERSKSRTNDEGAAYFNAGIACADAPAGRAPDRPAILHESEDGSSSLTFRELADRSSALARSLVGGGLGPGANVAVFAPAGPLAALAHVAVLKAGAASVPLVPLLGDEAILHRLTDSEARTLMVAPELIDSAMGLVERLANPPAVMPLAEDTMSGGSSADGFSPVPTTAEDPAMVLYTSGTTGKSKGAVLPHRVVLARHAPMSMIHGPFLPEDVFWTPADWMWVGSLVDSVFAPLSLGCTVMTYARLRFDPADAIERIKRMGVTRAFIPPTALRLLMDQPESLWEGHRLRSIHSGGEALTTDAAAWAKEVLDLTVDEIYGMTEASFVIGNAHRYGPATSGSMGRPFPGQVARVVDTGGQPVRDGEVGELQIADSSPSLFLGYYGQPEATAERFSGGWFSTGDLVRRAEDGCLFFAGRMDDLIMSAGHRIGPGEIEDVLKGHAAVRDAIVVGEPDPDRGQRIKAVVQLAGGEPEDGLTLELQDLVRARVGRHAYPRTVEYLVEFPRTPTGKVRRDQLRLAPEQRADAVAQPIGGRP
jgi:acetyl-CoA synthetase